MYIHLPTFVLPAIRRESLRRKRSRPLLSGLWSNSLRPSLVRQPWHRQRDQHPGMPDGALWRRVVCAVVLWREAEGTE